MTHFLVMTFFALLVAIVFGAIGRDTARGRVLYGVKVFVEFVGVGFMLAWLLYWIPN